jgi:hypothetical protein
VDASKEVLPLLQRETREGGKAGQGRRRLSSFTLAVGFDQAFVFISMLLPLFFD